ncbi:MULTISPECIES: hypothetical protein [unclassified Yoonia]|uniref:hypothetical protein n=1 Tax=unclassified Yoonia TaxID=2629118 RepID=UPI002AFE4473|nr:MULTISPECIES: hypothetical protein [unclassified Yoonia]
MSDKSALIKTAARRAGQFITIAALIFLALALYRQWGEVSAWQPTPLQIGLLVLLTLAYSAALLLLAYNWVTIIGTLVEDPVPQARLLLSYTQTQIAKYVPGNVVHLVGRHLYLRDRGVAHRSLAMATLLELVSLPVAAIVALVLVVPVIDIAYPTLPALWTFGWILPVAAAASVAAMTYFVQKRWRVPMILVLIRGTGFMLSQGILFAIILAAVAGHFVMLAIPVAILAWLIGFLTPGAPGGLAVREAVLVSLLGYAGMNEGVLLAALLMRLVTTAGDFVLYLLPIGKKDSFDR